MVRNEFPTAATMDDEGWEKAKKQKLDVVVVADDNDANMMNLGDSSVAAAVEGPSPSWSPRSCPSPVWDPDKPCPGCPEPDWGPVNLPRREVEEDDWETNDEIMMDKPLYSDDDDDDYDIEEKLRNFPFMEAELQRLQKVCLEPLKKAQKESLDMYDRLEKKFNASSEEWRCMEWKERVDRVRTILKEDPEFRMWEHREYEDLMLIVNDYHVFKTPYHGLRIKRDPVDGALVGNTFCWSAYGYDEKRDQQCVDLQKKIENLDPAKEDPDPSYVLSKAQEFAKPFKLLRSKDVKRAVDDYLHKESCKKMIGITRDLLKQFISKKRGVTSEDVSKMISSISVSDTPEDVSKLISSISVSVTTEDVSKLISAIFVLPFPGIHSLLYRLVSIDDENEAMKVVDDECERKMNDFKEAIISRADYLSLKLHLANKFGF